MRKLMRWSLMTLTACVFAGALVGGTMLLHARAAATKDAARHEPAPVVVETMAVALSDTYDVVDRFVGRLEPAQQVPLSFERAGLVTSIAVDEGMRVEAGQTIATLDTEVLRAERDRLLGQRKQVSANLELARLTADRQRALQSQGHASVQRLDETRLGVTALEGERAALDAAIRRLDIDIAKSVIRAPFAGTVGARHVDTGIVVAAGIRVIDLLQSDRPQARVGVTPEAAARLAPGDDVTLTSGGHRFAAMVAAVRPDLSTATRTVSVLFDVVDPAGMNFGDTIELHLVRQVPARGFWLPLNALNEGERGLWTVLTVNAVAAGGHAVGRETVEVLHTDGTRAFVRGTLRAGQRIIASGRNRVVPGQQVGLAGDGRS